MKKAIIFSMSVLLLFVSCGKDELEVTLKQSGSLSVVLKFRDGTPIAEEPVFLFADQAIYDSYVTDQNGLITIGELLEGNYTIFVDDIEIEGVNYQIEQSIQVISGSSQTVNLIPEDFVGKINFEIIERVYDADNNLTEIPIEGATVFAVDYQNYYNYGDDIDMLIELAIVSANTTSGGIAKLSDIPANKSFVLVYYVDDKKDFSTYNNYFILFKNQEVDLTVYKTFATVFANFYNYAASSPYNGLNVLIVESYDFYNNNSSLASLKSVAKKSGVTDANGDIVFERVTYDDYRLVYYSTESNYNNYSINVNNPMETVNITVY